MLTKETLDMLPENTIFACGTTVNGPAGIFMTSDFLGKEIRWVAIRGRINDWAIYVGWNDKYLTEETANEKIAANGDKIYNPATIKDLVNPTEEALKLYRF